MQKEKLLIYNDETIDKLAQYAWGNLMEGLGDDIGNLVKTTRDIDTDEDYDQFFDDQEDLIRLVLERLKI